MRARCSAWFILCACTWRANSGWIQIDYGANRIEWWRICAIRLLVPGARAHFQWPWVPRVPRTCVVPLLFSIIRIGMHNESLYRRNNTIHFGNKAALLSLPAIASTWLREHRICFRGHNHRMRKPPRAQRPRVREREREEKQHLDYWRKFSILCARFGEKLLKRIKRYGNGHQWKKGGGGLYWPPLTNGIRRCSDEPGRLKPIFRTEFANFRVHAISYFVRSWLFELNNYYRKIRCERARKVENSFKPIWWSGETLSLSLSL